MAVDAAVWGEGAAYEPYIGRWSRHVAAECVRRLDVEPGGDWRDIGCGTGAVTQAVLDGADPERVVGADPSDAYVRYARRHVTDARARFVRADAMGLPFPDGRASAAVSGLVLNFVPVPERAVAEMARIVRPGGTVAAYLWDYTQGGMQLIRHFWEAAVSLDAGSRELDEAVRFPWCAPGPLEELLRSAGMTDVAVDEIRIPTRFRDFDDYWAPFLGGQGPAPSYLAALPPERHDALRERLRARLPVEADGSIALTARAWNGRGRRPAR
ncbi:methyltransferase domain-containing protein [Streptomyces sp. ZAF1911]|uniref:class I SAM-dependent methyltransferase n=1 Tax=Streptomyces sp. ZAF1911 TaxID=2944129 RepID=UPI00237C37EF|nr:class I SAM-dependent methyltransferase [Streptomyces sp. ZAF1911]MDD9380066.1 methyltransferase domain-containing protein [Streptomyces sp. ZAF1911]